jgi:hypothetical protein
MAGRTRWQTGDGGRAEASAVVWADPLGMVALGLPASWEFLASRIGLLALGRLGAIGRV